jgi:peptidylprolyl isomerase
VELYVKAMRKNGWLLGIALGVVCSGCGSEGEQTSHTAPPVPPDVSAVPADATRTNSGLAYRVLQSGNGTQHPAVTDQVQVHYSGWTTDGKMFDSSVTRGQPSSFGLGGVIKGWTEGVQLMIEGEKTRFWLPPDLGYGENPPPRYPAGMLVFDIELLKIL